MKQSIANCSIEIERKFNSIESRIEQIGNILIVQQPGVKKKTRLSMKELVAMDTKINELRTFYAEKLYVSIRESVTDTLKLLAEACGFRIGAEVYELDTDDKDTVVSDDSTRFTRIRSGDVVPGQPLLFRRLADDIDNRAVSVTGDLSKSTWSNQRQLEQAYLQ